jgi:hypothetical protein
METLTGRSRLARPRREPEAGLESRGRENTASLAALTSILSSSTVGPSAESGVAARAVAASVAVSRKETWFFMNKRKQDARKDACARRGPGGQGTGRKRPADSAGRMLVVD